MTRVTALRHIGHEWRCAMVMAVEGRATVSWMSRSRMPLWWWWIPLVWAVSLPWFGFTPSPQWSRIHWVPLTDPADKLRDIAVNVALFVPFGFSYAARSCRFGRAIAGATVAAALVSITAEATQLFSTLRYPSGTDVCAACAGAFLGVIGRPRAGVVRHSSEDLY